jgi:ankyrin repeat protein
LIPAVFSLYIPVGFLLHRINGELIEHLPFADAMAKVLRSKSPHFAEFLRYDYRYNPFSCTWNSLQELRDMGVCVEDPLFARINFVNTAAQGKLRDVHDLLLQGEDPNSADLSGNTALVMAAANKHPEVVEMLVNAGANVNCRDKNVSTHFVS